MPDELEKRRSGKPVKYLNYEGIVIFFLEELKGIGEKLRYNSPKPITMFEQKYRKDKYKCSCLSISR